MQIKKERRLKSKKHLQYISELQCCAMSLSCNGGVQAHHLLKPWVGSRGMSMKADDRNAIPLCLHHHSVLHTRHGSEKSFFASLGRDEYFAINKAKELWDSSPANKAFSESD